MDMFEMELKNIKQKYYGERLKVFPFAKVQLTFVCFYDLYTCLKTGKPLTAVQQVKCDFLDSLLHLAIPEDIDEIFEKSENF